MNAMAQTYMENQINTASQGQLVLMLYDGGRRFTNKAIKAMEGNDIAEAHKCLLRAQEVVGELIMGLNHDAGEISKQLEQLYEYMQHLLVEANLNKDVKPATQVLNMLGELRETWTQILKG